MNILILRKLSRLMPAAILAIGSLSTASASLVYDAAIVVTGAGFGNIPRDLTVHGQGNATATSGCVGVDGSGDLTFGTCLSDALVFDGNGVTNVGGDEPNPLDDNQKYGAPTLVDLGITSASQIQIIFDATQGGGGSVTVADLTLKFYDVDGLVVGAIDGQHVFGSTVPGNGGAGFAFRVSDDELSQVNAFLASTSRLALEASFTGTGGGPESFFIRNGEVPSDDSGVPEPSTWMMLGGGFFSFGALRLGKRFPR